MSYEFGSTYPQISRLALMRKLLIWLSITFLVLNFLLPSGFLALAFIIGDNHVNDEDLWRQSLQLCNDVYIQFMLAFNIQMVYFYYKLALPIKDRGTVDVIESEAIENSQSGVAMTTLSSSNGREFGQMTNSFRRFMEDQSLDVKERETMIFENKVTNEKSKFLAQAVENRSLASSSRSGSSDTESKLVVKTVADDQTFVKQQILFRSNRIQSLLTASMNNTDGWQTG
jgi:hypothetical protein